MTASTAKKLHFAVESSWIMVDERFGEGRGGEDDDESGHCDSLRRAAGQDEGPAARGHIRFAA